MKMLYSEAGDAATGGMTRTTPSIVVVAVTLNASAPHAGGGGAFAGAADTLAVVFRSGLACGGPGLPD